MKTNKLLITNIILFFLFYYGDKILTDLGLIKKYGFPVLFIIEIIIIITSIIGVIIGIKEYKAKARKAFIGIIGNSIIVLFFLCVIIFGVLLTRSLS